MSKMLEEVQVLGSMPDPYASILTPDALRFLADLQKEFGPTRETLLSKRLERQSALNRGELPDFLPGTASVREGNWSVAPCPADLLDRRVEITGPAEPKMIINALNCGANVFMADFEDALSPTWSNLIEGQLSLKEAVRKTLSFTSPEGKEYKLGDKLATLVVRPRGWHLPEKHVLVGGKAMSASLFDFGLYFFHNAHELIKRGSGPYFYLPKMESHREARLWNDVFNFAQDRLGIPQGTIRATVLIETILAAFEMDEILYELMDHAAGLNAGRWDYIFSIIKKFSNNERFVLPDRAQVTMAVPFMRSYTELLVKTCHRRKAHAIGGMAAFIPSRKDPQINEVAYAKVREDKRLETARGFDGTWVAHPDLVAVAREAFDAAFGSEPHQKSKRRDDVNVSAADLLDVRIESGKISEAGLTTNVDVALQYIDSWLNGVGAAAIHNLMEDAATAEISRAQMWQWIRHGVKLDNGRTVDKSLYDAVRKKELASLTETGPRRFAEAAEILDKLVHSDQFIDFLTIAAYDRFE